MKKQRELFGNVHTYILSFRARPGCAWRTSIHPPLDNSKTLFKGIKKSCHSSVSSPCSRSREIIETRSRFIIIYSFPAVWTECMKRPIDYTSPQDYDVKSNVQTCCVLSWLAFILTWFMKRFYWHWWILHHNTTRVALAFSLVRKRMVTVPLEQFWKMYRRNHERRGEIGS